MIHIVHHLYQQPHKQVQQAKNECVILLYITHIQHLTPDTHTYTIIYINRHTNKLNKPIMRMWHHYILHTYNITQHHGFVMEVSCCQLQFRGYQEETSQPSNH